MKRRNFAAAATTLAAAQLLPPRAAARPRVGMSDVTRLEAEFHDLVASDNQHGGSISLETRAIAFAQHALEQQKVGTATSRVRNRLYYLAAAFTGTALWAAVDSHHPERARTHLRNALYLADLSGNSQMRPACGCTVPFSPRRNPGAHGRLWMPPTRLARRTPAGAMPSSAPWQSHDWRASKRTRTEVSGDWARQHSETSTKRRTRSAERARTLPGPPGSPSTTKLNYMDFPHSS